MHCVRRGQVQRGGRRQGRIRVQQVRRRQLRPERRGRRLHAMQRRDRIQHVRINNPVRRL